MDIIHEIFADGKMADKAIQNYVAKLKRSNQELDDFAYIASHDLKEPLRGLSNNALFLAEDYEELLEDDGKRRIARMKMLCKRLENLVDDLLYYSRLGRQDLAIQNTNLNALIQENKVIKEETTVKKVITKEGSKQYFTVRTNFKVFDEKWHLRQLSNYLLYFT